MGAATAVGRAPGTVREQEAYAALGAVVDPELDEPITDLGFVRSLELVEGLPGASRADVLVHLRLPTSFCSPSFAYLMAADAKDALVALAWTDRVVVELDDHHDSAVINAGLAADAGFVGTYGAEAERDLEELRTTFRRKAHTAALERCLTALLLAEPQRPVESVGAVTLAQLPADERTAALLRRRSAIGLPASPADAPDALVLVDHTGRGYPPQEVPLALRRARSTRISIDGNAHFCRGLLATRYPDEAVPAPEQEPAFVPLSTLVTKEHTS